MIIANMKYTLLLLFAFFVESTQIQAQSEKLIESHFQKMTNAREYTLAVANLVMYPISWFSTFDGKRKGYNWILAADHSLI